jgi:glutathione peroxidase
MKALIIISAFLLFALTGHSQEKKSFYDFTVTDIDGKPFSLATLKGKKVLVVNVASKCGNTPQYAQLEDLYKTYGPDKFVIIGFPENNFLSQEPGTNEQIKEFCTSKYGVTFPMMSKISVKGKDMAPVYKWLTSKDENGVLDAPIKWNFQKFMIDENGKIVDVIAPGESPMTPKILNWIQGK